jgi:histidinol dehydrogenase
MIRILDWCDEGFDASLAALLERDSEASTTDLARVEEAVRAIIGDVRRRGDAALLELTGKFDRLEMDSGKSMEIHGPRADAICESVTGPQAEAIRFAALRIRRYHEQEVAQSWQMREDDGTVLGQKITPLDRVGVYVPGGKAAYPSSVLMTVIPARVAGVGEVIMTVPTPHGEINPAIIFAAREAGVDRIFTVGGAQAIAALAWGTETIPAVDKIVGPGNIYVATAKRQVFGKVGIDMIAGPSEVVVICDQSANPDWVAMDLFAQAEHDELAQSIAIAVGDGVAEAVTQSIGRLLPEMERHEIISAALQGQGAIIHTDSPERAAEIANRIAPEHLELMLRDPLPIVDRIRHAGAIFIGSHSAESLGDYCAGPNHVLPTSGTARFSSPLGVYDFQKRSSLIHASVSGAVAMGRHASILARCEGLTAHARSAEYRTGEQDA